MRDPDWQFGPDYTNSRLGIQCIEIKPTVSPLFDDRLQPPEKLRKVTLILSYWRGHGDLCLLLVTTNVHKQKNTYLLRPTKPDQGHSINAIVKRLSETDLQTVFSTLRPDPCYSMLSTEKWTMLAVYDPVVSEYYQALHGLINYYLQNYLSTQQTTQKLEISEVGCGFGDALRLVLESLHPRFDWQGHGVDLDAANIAEAAIRTNNHPDVTLMVGSFLATDFFARLYQSKSKEPHTQRIIISSGGMSIATVPDYQHVLWFFQQAYQYEVDLLIFGSVTAIPWHQPLLKKLGYQMEVQASTDDFTRPLYILHRRVQDCSFEKIAARLINHTVHLNLQGCHKPLSALSALSSCEKESVVSIDLSYCDLTSRLVADLESLFVGFSNLRTIFYQSLLENREPLDNNRNTRWRWLLISHSMQDIIQHYLFRKNQIHNKFVVYLGSHNQCNILPYASFEECRAIVEGYNNSNLGEPVDTQTCHAHILDCLERAAEVYPLLLLVLIFRYKNGYVVVNEEVPNESGYVGRSAISSHFNFPGELRCYRSLHQQGFFGTHLMKAILKNRVIELEEEAVLCQSPSREENTEQQVRVQEGLSIFREAEASYASARL